MPKKFWEKLGKLFTFSSCCCVKDNHVMLPRENTLFDDYSIPIQDIHSSSPTLHLSPTNHGHTSYQNIPPLDTIATSPSSPSLYEGENLFLFLPNDIIMDTLVRLDIKSTLQCRRVCKSFYEMMSTPSFISMHLINRDTPILVVLCKSLCSVTHDKENNLYTYHMVLHFIEDQGSIMATSINISLTYLLEATYIYVPRLIGSYNGLLLFRPILIDALFIFNPITREQVLVTAPPLYEDCGLYFHTPTSEYRILYMFSNFKDPMCKFFVFSLSSKLSREISGYAKAPRTCRQPVILDGRLHWMASIPGIHICACRNSTSCAESILVFNMISEDFITMPHPGSQCFSKERHGMSMLLSEMDGHLCVCDTSMDIAKLFVWVLEDYKQQVWVTRYTIDIEPMTTPQSHCDPCVEALKIQNDKLLLRKGCQFLYYYNLKLHTVRELERGSKEFMNSVVVHNKSVASLNTDRLISWEHMAFS